MKHHLILRFEALSGEELEEVAALEDLLIEKLGNRADVDGHDVDGDVASLSVITSDPHETWSEIERLIETAGDLGRTLSVAAFRPINSDDYVLLWPDDYDGDLDFE